MNSKKLVITLGGTGGHVFPGIALAEQLCDVDTLFVGGRLATNRYFAETKAPFEEVACGSIPNIMRGIKQSWQILRRHRPQIVVGFGSYYTFPTLVAAKLLCIPIVLHEANALPGKVHRLLSPFATLTGVHFPEAAPLLWGNVQAIGMPLREKMGPEPTRRTEALRYFGLEEGRPTLLIFGGSQGAEAINRAAREAIPDDVQVIHITGKENAPQPKRGIAKPYETRMELAWEVADLVVSRAGAGTCAELEAYGTPAILIPFPRAADNHQERNADCMGDQVYKILEQDLTPSTLRKAIESMKEKKRTPKNRSQELAEAVQQLLETA